MCNSFLSFIDVLISVKRWKFVQSIHTIQSNVFWDLFCIVVKLIQYKMYLIYRSVYYILHRQTHTHTLKMIYICGSSNLKFLLNRITLITYVIYIFMSFYKTHTHTFSKLPNH